ncbi:MAG: dihydrodipicolinate reductase C-terminal domain-containing protein, partial [Bacteroidia bacterium]|nr:4-hydroxy-tetrahydrodipicolinate reductase [Bacteroidia bacterium]MDW8158603.1 dihydrodipicolinate reductase C-terminal domain-containing protein [Bacteroidia bacterium]
MNIGLVGFGKMGKTIAHLCSTHGHKISTILEAEQMQNFSSQDLDLPDCWIEFTIPQAVISNLERLIPTQKPIVVGTTGWYENLEKIQALCHKYQVAVLYGPNFSLGVALLQKLNRLLAQWMQAYPEFDCAIHEVHHNQKKDAPSGTALALAQTLLENLPRKKKTACAGELTTRAPLPEELVISSSRVGNIAGT